MVIEQQIRIERPADQVFAFVSDVENNPRWQDGMVRCRWTSAPPHGVGSTYEQEARFLGRPIPSTFEVTAYEPGRRLAIESIQSTFPIQVDRTVTRAGDDACVFRARIAGDPGWMAWALGPVMQWMVARSVRGDQQQLKALLEGGPDA